MEQAFTKPEMIEAIEKLAENLPQLAEAVADLVAWASENPGKAGGLALGAKTALPFGAGLLGSLAGLLFKGGNSAVAKEAAKKASEAVLKAGGSKAAAAAAAQKAAASAGTGAGAILGVPLAGAAAAAGVYATYHRPREQAYEAGLEAVRKRGPLQIPESLEGKRAALTQRALAAGHLMHTFATPSHFPGMLGLGENPLTDLLKAQKELAGEMTVLSKAITEVAGPQGRNDLRNFKNGVENAGRALQKAFPHTPTGGPRGTNPLDNKPGHEPKKG
jgi:hypothetical protein